MRVLKWCFYFLLVYACSSSTYTLPENALDAGRQFADAVYKGNFKRAGDLIVPTVENKNLLQDKLENDYHQRTSDDRNRLALASLQILDVTNLAQDSSTLIRFKNAYTNEPGILKIIKQQGNWLVDLKYTFTGKPG